MLGLLGSRRRSRARARLNRCHVQHPCLLLAADEGVEGGVGVDDLVVEGALQARMRRMWSGHVIWEVSCRDGGRR